MNKRLLIPGLVATAVIAGILAAASASNTGYVVLNPAGIIAEREKRLMLFALGLSLIVVVPVLTMLGSFAWKYRETNTKANYQPDWGGSRVAESIWWGVPLTLILCLSIVTWHSSHELDPFRALASDKKPLTIQVVALQWKWLFIYPEQHVATVNFVEFPKDTPVNFQVTADAPMNSFLIPQLGGQIYAMNGMSTQLHLMASRTGDFRGLSANISGDGFSSMHFIARAATQDQFDNWLETVYEAPNTLDYDTYQKLAKPSQPKAPTLYASSQDDLYDTILMKYMMPHKNPLTSQSEDALDDASVSSMDHMNMSEMDMR